MSKNRVKGGNTDLMVTTVYMPCEDCSPTKQGGYICAQATWLNSHTVREMHLIRIIKQNRPLAVLAGVAAV